jgi:protein O-GlcNAc transferase
MKVYVSLTTIYDNQTILLITLKSLLNQTRRADTYFLMVSEAPYLLDKGFANRQMTPDLSSFLDQHKDLIVVQWVENTGPYRKLLPLLKAKWNEDCLIITVDDDTEYHPSLIENYLRDWDQHHCCLSYRGFTFKMANSLKLLDYEKRDKLNHKYLYNFHTGKGGVVYHPDFFKKSGDLVFNRDLFRECCETGDDIWFNFVRIANGVECFVVDRQYMTKDCSTPLSLYVHYNMKSHLNTVNIQKTVTKLISLNVLRDVGVVFDSDRYWENRYKNKGTSGDGSYGDKAEFKGQFLSQFIKDPTHSIKTIIDYGVGDGNQLKYIDTTGKKYLGLDVSATAVQKCRELYKNDHSKTFMEVKAFSWSAPADLAISSDVIFHLVDDTVYQQYMKNLFAMSSKYVIIHAVDNDHKQAVHVLFRKFTPYVAQHFPEWTLISFTRNQLWTGEAGKMGFHVYQKS